MIEPPTCRNTAIWHVVVDILPYRRCTSSWSLSSSRGWSSPIKRWAKEQSPHLKKVGICSGRRLSQRKLEGR